MRYMESLSNNDLAIKFLIAVNCGAYVVLWFFVRMWIKDVKTSVKDLNDKLEKYVTQQQCSMAMTNMCSKNSTEHTNMFRDLTKVEELARKHRHDDEKGEVIIVQ